MPTKKSSAKKTAHKWSAAVTTDSTHPEHDLFNQDAQTIASSLFSKKVSPKGPSSGMRMLNFYINRAGKNLSEERVATLNQAKQLLSKKIAESKPAKKTTTPK
jgi:tRNA(adenine34) deaminase